jgi:hypothetical protein
MVTGRTSRFPVPQRAFVREGVGNHGSTEWLGSVSPPGGALRLLLLCPSLCSGPSRRGAGPMPFAHNSVRTLAAETLMPSFASSPVGIRNSNHVLDLQFAPAKETSQASSLMPEGWFPLRFTARLETEGIDRRRSRFAQHLSPSGSDLDRLRLAAGTAFTPSRRALRAI